MEELDASDWSLMTIWGLFISAVVLGCEGEICRVLLKYLQSYVRAGTETLTVTVSSVLSQRVRVVNTVVTRILNIKTSYNLGYS